MLQIRLEYIISFFIAFIVTFFATPMVRKLAFKIKAIDIPKDERRMHKEPIALLGGLAIIVGIVISLLYNLLAKTSDIMVQYLKSEKFIGFLIGAFIIILLGILDDIFELNAKIKFFIQILATAPVLLTGTVISFLSNPFESQTMVLFTDNFLVYVISILWIVGLTNAINFIDGLDGLAAGVSGIAALSLFVVSVAKGQITAAVLMVIIGGATLGFLPYNFNPAKIFMGDTGATFLGYCLGVFSIQGTLKHFTAIAVAIPVLVLGLPIFDTAFAMFRRILRGRPIGEADKEHIHHRLINMGLSQRQSVVIMYMISGALGLVSITLADKGLLAAFILVILVSIFVIGGIRNTNEINTEEVVEDESMTTLPEKEDIIKIIENTTENDNSLEEKS